MGKKKKAPLSLREIKNAEKVLILHAQEALFKEKKVFAGNFSNLCPFVEENKIIGVGGR